MIDLAAISDSDGEFLWDIFEQVPAMVAVFSGPHHQFVFANHVLASIIGRSPLDVFPEMEGQAFPDLLARVYASGIPHTGTEVEARYDRNGDGEIEEAFFNLVYQPILGKDNSVIAVMLHATEVTAQVLERRRIQQAMKQLTEECNQLRQSLEGMQSLEHQRHQFLASLSHDLRNPLTSISGTAQLLQRRIEPSGTSEDHRLRNGLETIHAASTRMTLMLNELLDLSHDGLEQSLDLHLAPADLIALVDRVVSAHQATTDQHQLVTYAVVPQLELSCDAPRLERVLANLLSNAIKFSPHGGKIVVAVTREQGESGEWAVLTVTDQGIGIPADEAERVFDRFYRGSNVIGQISGSGLGLSGVRQLVEGHGGEVAIESKPGAGSTFTVRIPLNSDTILDSSRSRKRRPSGIH